MYATHAFMWNDVECDLEKKKYICESTAKEIFGQARDEGVFTDLNAFYS